MIFDENTLLDPVAPVPSLIPCLFLRTMGALCPSRSQEYPNWRLFVQGKVVFSSQRRIYRTAILKALQCGWLGCLRQGLGIRHLKAQLLGICRQHVVKAGAVQQLGHLTRLTERAEGRDGSSSPALSRPMLLYWGTPGPAQRLGACCEGVSATQTSPGTHNHCFRAVPFLVALPRAMLWGCFHAGVWFYGERREDAVH